MSIDRKVWAKFEAKQKDGSVIKLRIEDFPGERWDEALNFMKNYFITDEAFHVAAGIQSYREYYDYPICFNFKFDSFQF